MISKKLVLTLWFIIAFLFFLGYFNLNLEHFNHFKMLSKDKIELFDIHNEKRNSKGIVELVLDENLCSYAQKHAEKMSEKNKLFHSSLKELKEFSGRNKIGENIAWGQKDAEEVFSSWMWSPMHRWNILSKSYNKIGIGIKEDEDRNKYWCVVFSD